LISFAKDGVAKAQGRRDETAFRQASDASVEIGHRRPDQIFRMPSLADAALAKRASG
jgi:hypothetical protein